MAVATTLKTLNGYLEKMGQLRVGRLGRSTRVQAILACNAPKSPLEDAYTINEENYDRIKREVKAFNDAESSLANVKGVRRLIRSVSLRLHAWWHNIEAKRCQLFYAQLFALVAQKKVEPTTTCRQMYENLFNTTRFSASHTKFVKYYLEIKQYIIDSIEKSCLHQSARPENFNSDYKTTTSERSQPMQPSQPTITDDNKTDMLCDLVKLREWLRTAWWHFLKGKHSFEALMETVDGVKNELVKNHQDAADQETQIDPDRAQAISKKYADTMIEVLRWETIITESRTFPNKLSSLSKLYDEHIAEIHQSSKEEELNAISKAFMNELLHYQTTPEYDPTLPLETEEQKEAAILSVAVTEATNHFKKEYECKIRQLQQCVAELLKNLCKKDPLINYLNEKQRRRIAELHSTWWAFLLENEQPQEAALVAPATVLDVQKEFLATGKKLKEKFLQDIDDVIDKEIQKEAASSDRLVVLKKIKHNFAAKYAQWEIIVTQSHPKHPSQLSDLIKVYKRTIANMRASCNKKELDERYRKAMVTLKTHTHDFTLLPETEEEKKVAAMLSAAVNEIELHFTDEYEAKNGELEIQESVAKQDQLVVKQCKKDRAINELNEDQLHRRAELQSQWWSFLVENKSIQHPSLAAEEESAFQKLKDISKRIRDDFHAKVKATEKEIKKRSFRIEKYKVVHTIQWDFETEFLRWEAIVKTSHAAYCPSELLKLIQLYNRTIVDLQESRNKKELDCMFTHSNDELYDLEKKIYDLFKNEKAQQVSHFALTPKTANENSVAVLNAALAEIRLRFEKEYRVKIDELQCQAFEARLRRDLCAKDPRVKQLVNGQKKQIGHLYSHWWEFLVENKQRPHPALLRQEEPAFQKLMAAGEKVKANFYKQIKAIKQQRPQKHTALDKIKKHFDMEFDRWQKIVNKSCFDPSPLVDLMEWFQKTITDMQGSHDKEALGEIYNKAKVKLSQYKNLCGENKEGRTVYTLRRAALSTIKSIFQMEYEDIADKFELREYDHVDRNELPEQTAVLVWQASSSMLPVIDPQASLEDLSAIVKQLCQDDTQPKAYQLINAHAFATRADTDLAQFNALITCGCNLLTKDSSALKLILDSVKDSYFYLIKNYHEKYYKNRASNDNIRTKAEEISQAIISAWDDAKVKFKEIRYRLGYAFFRSKADADCLVELEEWALKVQEFIDEEKQWNENFVNDAIPEEDRARFDAQFPLSAASSTSTVSDEPHNKAAAYGALVAMEQEKGLLLVDDRSRRVLVLLDQFVADFSDEIPVPKRATGEIKLKMYMLNHYRSAFVKNIKQPKPEQDWEDLATIYKDCILDATDSVLDDKIVEPLVSALTNIAKEYRESHDLVRTALHKRQKDLGCQFSNAKREIDAIKARRQNVIDFFKQDTLRLLEEKNQLREEVISIEARTARDRQARMAAEKRIAHLQVEIAFHRWRTDRLDAVEGKKLNSMKRSQSCSDLTSPVFFKTALTRSRSLLVVETEKDSHAYHCPNYRSHKQP